MLWIGHKYNFLLKQHFINKSNLTFSLQREATIYLQMCEGKELRLLRNKNFLIITRAQRKNPFCGGKV